MRKKIVAGNWKMNKTVQEGIALVNELNEVLAANKPNCAVVIGTPFTHITEVVKTANKAIISVAAQNCANKESGAYTGEISAAMIKSTGAEYVIIGHSERRAYYGEDNAILLRKTKLALENGATRYRESEDHGWMYYDSFADLDGHQWEIAWMDETYNFDDLKKE